MDELMDERAKEMRLFLIYLARCGGIAIPGIVYIFIKGEKIHSHRLPRGTTMTSRKGQRLIAYAAVTILALCNTLRRFMFEGVKPFDWLMLGIEAAVLLFVGYEVGVTITHQIKGVRYRRKLRGIAADLRGFLTSGNLIRQEVPSWLDGVHGHGIAWAESVQSWIANAEKYLAEQSPDRALVEFRHIAVFTQEQRRHMDEQGRTISGSLGVIYQQLTTRLDNLHQIALRCEDYF
jgi:hypothetical protein